MKDRGGTQVGGRGEGERSGRRKAGKDTGGNDTRESLDNRKEREGEKRKARD